MSKAPIVPVLVALNAEFSGLRDWGGEQPARCAFHGDRHASASVNPDKGLYNCHVCGIAGDAIAVVKHVEGIDFIAAQQRVADITGVDGGELSEGSHGGRSKLPVWSRDKAGRRRVLSNRPGRRKLHRA